VTWKKDNALSDKAQPEGDEQASRGILQYLVEHPDAKDTIEGILKWWLPDSRVWKRGEVQEALDLLTSKGWLTKRGTVPSRKIYGINKDRLPEITRFLQQSGAGS
jgi:hypothetical protein